MKKHAARKKAYHATDYFREQVIRIKEEKAPNWEIQAQQMEEMLKDQETIRQSMQGSHGDVELRVIEKSYAKFTKKFSTF